MFLSPGSRLTSYEIVSLLGSGGMGEVYKAKDLKLGRFVAIKVLPEEHAGDAERLKRFEQEARSASALDHPNIITIHDIDEDAGTHFIVMQYVEGKTLRELAGKLELSQTLDYGEQIAEGLARAHSHGIVHRDLKPANIMVTEDGLVKILDFGLAKLAEASELSEDSTRDMELKTKEGHVIGTAPYMSPEQAQGKKIDHRSDIFSFGAVLYEMVTDRRAFEEDSVAGLFAAIIKDDPKSISAILPSVPLDLEKLIARTMRKEPDRRSQSMADVRVELAEIREAVESGDFISASQIPKSVSRTAAGRRLTVAVGLLALGIAAWLFTTKRESLPVDPPRVVPLTTLPGRELSPALSPDGKQVAFVRGTEGQLDVHVRLVDGGEDIRLTETPAREYSLVWAPDGGRIAFLRENQEAGERGYSEILVVPTLGGKERRLGTIDAIVEHGPVFKSGLDWSPDGRFLAFADKATPEEHEGIFLLDVETGGKRRLTSPPAGKGHRDRKPAFSPDGRTVAFTRGANMYGFQIHLIPTSGGEPQLLKADDGAIWDLDWISDGSALVYARNFQGRGSLVRLSVPEAAASELSLGSGAGTVSIASSGNRLVYLENFGVNCNIWRADGPTARDHAPPLKLMDSTRTDYGQEYSPDGTKIAFNSWRSGLTAIWVCDSNGDSCNRVSEEGAAASAWSPSGKQIAFTRTENFRNPNVYIVDVESGFTRQLTQGESRSARPSWSRDEKWIYFQSNRSGTFQIYKMMAKGGHAVQLTTTGGRDPHESPDGHFVYYAKRRPVASYKWMDIWSVPVDGGEESSVLMDQHLQTANWTVWQGNIVYRHQEPGEGRNVIDVFDLNTRETRRLMNFEPRTGFCFGTSVSPDGRWLIYAQIEPMNTDIMMIENFIP